MTKLMIYSGLSFKVFNTFNISISSIFSKAISRSPALLVSSPFKTSFLRITEMYFTKFAGATFNSDKTLSKSTSKTERFASPFWDSD